MLPPASLQTALDSLLGDARLSATRLPGTDLSLWLIDPANMERAFSPEETRRILEEPPYWCFCWASGLVLARWLAERPEWVRGKRVLDFGAGSGVAAIAAANCTPTKAGTSSRAMPEKLSVKPRARVTAGFAKDVDAVNQ